MAQQSSEEDAAVIAEEPGIYDEDGSLRPSFMEDIRRSLQAGDAEALRRVSTDLHGSELGDVLEALESGERQAFARLTGDAFDFNSLTEVDETVRLEIIDALPNAEIAAGFRDLDSDDAVYILEDMESQDREEVLAKIPFHERARLRRALDYPEETAGRRMQTEFIAVPPFWTVGQTIDHMREDKDLPDRFSEIFTIEPNFKLDGAVALDRLLRTRREVAIRDIHDETLHPIAATLDQEEAAMVFERYDLLSAPVIDENGRLVGVLTIDDVVDVIQMEAEEDILRLAGVGDEELSGRIVETARSRFTWLLVNLATAIMASLVIALFDASLQQMVALAVLMPIVASMGGNAGTQTMTVAVRALATKDIDIHNTRRIVRREVMVGLLNGTAFAVLIGLVAAFWFSLPTLGVVIAAAMVVNMIAAALAGILIPITLDRLDIDPAIASSVFVTTVTDVVGFFAFLGLAAWWFGLG